MLLILHSGASKLRSANTPLRVNAVSNGHNTTKRGQIWRQGKTHAAMYDMVWACDGGGGGGAQCYLLLRPWSLWVSMYMCIWMPSRSLDLWIAVGSYEQTKQTEQGRWR